MKGNSVQVVTLDEIDLRRVHERAVWLYNNEKDTVAEAWLEAFSELLQSQGIKLELGPKRCYDGPLD